MARALCKNLKLSIELEDAPHGEQILITLGDDLAMAEVQECYPVSTTTNKKVYHRTEAIVICLRRLIHRACDEGLISTSPGVSMTPNIGNGAVPTEKSSSITPSIPKAVP